MMPMLVAGSDPERVALSGVAQAWTPAEAWRACRRLGSHEPLKPEHHGCGSCRRIHFLMGQRPIQAPNGRWHHPKCWHLKRKLRGKP